MSSQPAEPASNRARSLVVIPSSELDAHLHEEAEELARARHQAPSLSPWRTEVGTTSPLPSHPGHSTACEEEGGEQIVEWGGDMDDVMTPPSVLLERALHQAETSTNNKQAEDAVRQWVRCAALSRIVHGNSHWQRGRCCVHLASTYLNFSNLPEQALLHAEKGRGILTSHLISCDADPQAVLALALAHCIIGRVLTTRGILSKAETALQKSRRTLERYSSRAPASVPVIELDLDIKSATGRLCCKQEDHSSAKDWFIKAIERCRVGFGVNNPRLVPLLQELASAELKSGEEDKGVHTLEEALDIAEKCGGSKPEVSGSVLLALARAHTPNPATPEVAQEYFERAFEVYSSLCMTERAIVCKEELCRHLMSVKGTDKEAVSLLKEIVDLKKQFYGDYSLELANSYKWLGAVYLSMNSVELAKKALLKAKTIFSSLHGEKHKETASITQTLETVTGSETLTMSTTRVEQKPRFKTVV